MRTFEERTRLIHKRTEELRKKKLKRKQTAFDIAATIVCLIYRHQYFLFFSWRQLNSPAVSTASQK